MDMITVFQFLCNLQFYLRLLNQKREQQKILNEILTDRHRPIRKIRNFGGSFEGLPFII